MLLEKRHAPERVRRRVSPFQGASREAREASAFPPAPCGEIHFILRRWARWVRNKPLPQRSPRKPRRTRRKPIPGLGRPGMPLGDGGRKLIPIIELSFRRCRLGRSREISQANLDEQAFGCEPELGLSPSVFSGGVSFFEPAGCDSAGVAGGCSSDVAVRVQMP